MTLLLQYTLIFASVLILVALGGCFAEHSGVINLGLEGIMIMGALGGALLIPAGLLMGAHPVGVRLKGLLILAALVAVSAVGFSFYNQLLRYHPVGQIAIYNAFIPVLGVVLSCLLLGEPFSWRYLLSGALVTVGICAVNLPGKGKN